MLYPLSALEVMFLIERLVIINLDPVLVDQNSVTTFKNALVPKFWLYIAQLGEGSLGEVYNTSKGFSTIILFQVCFTRMKFKT